MLLLRLPEVLTRSGYSRSTLYRRIDAGLFPRPVKPSQRISAWPLDEVDLILSQTVRGASEEELRALVQSMYTERKRL
jgi:prophage regulatory protein